MLPKTILVPTDFSDHAEQAARYATELAQKLDARVHLLHAYTVPVLGPPDLAGGYLSALSATMEAEGAKGLDAAKARHHAATANLLRADPRAAIVDFARKLDADLIVMGTHGRTGLSRAVLGSVAEYTVRHAPCPVLTVRAKGRR